MWYHSTADSKHRKVLEAIFEKPERANIAPTLAKKPASQ
jgi:hypothetical protein